MGKIEVVLLVSGGLDSFIAYHYLKKDVYKVTPLFIDYKGGYTDKEFKVANSLFPNLIVDKSIHLGNLEKGDKAFIKNRNAYFAFIASNYGKTICMAGLKDDNVGDKSPLAFQSMSELLTIINKDVYIVFSPFWRMTKSDIIGWYCGNNGSMDELVATTSCYHPTEHFCGECPSCFRKWCAFHDNNIHFYLPYFTNRKLIEEYIKNIKNYDKSRQKSIFNTAKKIGVI